MSKIWIAMLLPAMVCAQAPVDKEFRANWEMSKRFTLAVADAMPAAKYGFKVNEEEMSFAALMIHIASTNAFRFAQISGSPSPLTIPSTIPKADVKEIAKKLLADSFDYCIAQLDRFTPAQMDQLYKVDWFEREQVNGRQLVLGMFVHTAHHRAQAEVYLRANGIKPPDYRF